MTKNFKQTNTKEYILYNKILLLSRNKLFYTKFGLADTFQNRIHLIFLHTSFLFVKIKQNKQTSLPLICRPRFFQINRPPLPRPRYSANPLTTLPALSSLPHSACTGLSAPPSLRAPSAQVAWPRRVRRVGRAEAAEAQPRARAAERRRRGGDTAAHGEEAADARAAGRAAARAAVAPFSSR